MIAARLLLRPTPMLLEAELTAQAQARALLALINTLGADRELLAQLLPLQLLQAQPFPLPLSPRGECFKNRVGGMKTGLNEAESPLSRMYFPFCAHEVQRKRSQSRLFKHSLGTGEGPGMRACPLFCINPFHLLLEFGPLGGKRQRLPVGWQKAMPSATHHMVLGEAEGIC